MKKVFSGPLCLTSVATLCLLLPHVSMAAKSAYIEAVQAEVGEFQKGKFDLAEDSQWVIKQGNEAVTIAAPADAGGLQEFNELLKKKLRGTYILYRKLSPTAQSEVYQQYKDTGDLGAVRTNIYAARRGGKSVLRRSERDGVLDL